MNAKPLPTVIQGGMGAGVSGWPLARAVSRAGQMGVVAGTALDVILARRLQIGDPGGHMQRALAHFPVAGIADQILGRYLIPAGKAEAAPFKALPLLGARASPEREALIVAANFTEVFLSKEGHAGVVGINYLEKIQLPTLPSVFGALLAGVDYVLMGAGIPRSIPAVLDDLAAGKAVQLTIDVRAAAGDAKLSEKQLLHFDPSSFCGSRAPTLVRPAFLAIVASVTVATIMARKSSGRVDGLIIEGDVAGGHNAPPRGQLKLNSAGEPIFGERDVVDLSAIAKLGLPFWLAGSWASPERLDEARGLGATGVQVGTAFAFCRESGIQPDLKRRAVEQIRAGTARVLTDPLASPTGFPFKVFQLEDTFSNTEVFESRKKVCDLGYLRHAYARPEGGIGWRCPGEPDAIFLRKGGDQKEIHGRKCVCNGLMANIGLGQLQRNGELEKPLLTSGADTSVVAELVAARGVSYSATDVLEHLLGQTAAETGPTTY